MKIGFLLSVLFHIAITNNVTNFTNTVTDSHQESFNEVAKQIIKQVGIKLRIKFLTKCHDLSSVTPYCLSLTPD